MSFQSNVNSKHTVCKKMPISMTLRLLYYKTIFQVIMDVLVTIKTFPSSVCRNK